MGQTTALVAELKRTLRENRLTYRRVGEHLGLTEASVKRMFARETFSLDRLERILEIVGMQISDLVERMESRREFVNELTPEQEEALVNDSNLLVLAFLVLNRWSVEDIQAVYDFDEQEIQRLLIRLDRLKLIDLLPFNRYRLLTTRNFTWRKDGPVQQLFADRIQKEFFASRFDGPGEQLRFIGGRLSPDAIAEMHRAIVRIAAQFDELAESDSRLPINESYGCSAVFALRPMEFSMFADHRVVATPKVAPLES